ncbi:DUF302 domain-containing protein [Clostridium psychrophilum]|uniref:DUF302 domain-containing protein n=1 Tax=Clostridium psychrophilum TaxID=132926 RepID=UPI001C0E6F8E|nr:DUF302 domain-containing protein [Clostridium psychrophilum]MBU3183063.1 DUF302 domain-containing protein [Clostridium psychrophilum]
MNIKYEVKVGKLFGEAVESLKKSLSENKFGVLWELDFKDKLKEKGLEFDTNFKILEVCNPVKAKEVLSKNIETGYFLPCKMVVYEKKGSVYIGMIKPTDLIKMMGDKELIAIAKDIEKVLKKSIDDAI